MNENKVKKIKKITKKDIQKRIIFFLLYAKFVKYFFIFISVLISIVVFINTKNIAYTIITIGVGLVLSSIGIFYSNSVEYQSYILDYLKDLNSKTPKK